MEVKRQRPLASIYSTVSLVRRKKEKEGKEIRLIVSCQASLKLSVSRAKDM